MTELSNVPNGAKRSPAERLRNLPAWVSVLLIALIVGGAGWFLWKQWYAGPDVGEAIDVGNENIRRGMRGFPRVAAAAPAKEGVTLLGAGLWRVKTGEFSMNLSTRNADIRVFYDKADLLPRDQVQMLQARRDVVGNPARAKQLNVSPEQIKLLGAIPGGVGGGMKLADADRQRLKSLWETYNSTPADAKPARESELMSSLKEVGQNSLGPTRQQYTERVEKIKAVFTPEQIGQLTR